MMKNMTRETDNAKDLENNQNGCLESEENSKMVEARCMLLEIEVEDLKNKNKELEEQIARIQKVMTNEERRGKEAIIDLTGDETENEEFIQLRIQIRVLECEKAKAEKNLCFWKEKVKQLVSQVCELESKLNMKGTNESSIEINDAMLHLDKDNQVSTPKCDIQISETGANRENCNKVRKRLPFEEKKFSPPTPGFAPPPSSSVVDISDEDDNMDAFTSSKRKRCSNIITSDDVDETDTNIRKRKNASNIVTSNDETSYDDNALISTLIKKDHNNEVKEDASRQPLKRLKKSDDITIDLHKSDEDDVDNDMSDESEVGLDEYNAMLDKIGRKRDFKRKWELEGDMLADLGKDTELCMRAVCALYRQQTENEKAGKVTIDHNARGFSQTDAFRGSKLAQFLIDGDSNGDLNKTVEELKRYDTKGVELCMALATKYSKQLFQIFQNKEDPYFLP